jgi:hypothetical protein
MSRARRKRRKISKLSSSNYNLQSQPDPCKTPATPAPEIPIPYPNIAKSSDTAKGSKKVKHDGNPINLKSSNFNKSVGDEEGTSSSSPSLRRVRKRSRLRRKTGF